MAGGKGRLKDPKVVKKTAWKYFSLFVRLRDGDGTYSVCISCGIKKHYKDMQAGHYISAGRSNATYFDERNVNCQCVRCNKWLSGNLGQYALALERKYGHGILQELEKKSRKYKSFTLEELIDIIKTYKSRIENEDFGKIF